MRSLGRAKDPELIKRTLDMAFGGEVKDQDVYMPLAGLRAHTEGTEALFGWMVENWELITTKIPPAMSMLGHLVNILTSSFTTKEQLEKVEKFFADKSTAGFEMNLAQSLDSIRSKVTWVERDREDVSAWAKENKYL